MLNLRWKRRVCRGRVEYHASAWGAQLFTRHVGEGVWIWSTTNRSTGEHFDGWNCSEWWAKERAEKAAEGGDRE